MEIEELAIWLWVPAALAVLVIVQWWLGQACQKRIRRWADENGYAILSIEYRRHWSSLLLPLIGWLGGGNWYVRIQDDEGGQRAGRIYFGSPWLSLPWGRLSVEWE